MPKILKVRSEMVEHERAYIFTHQGIKDFLKIKGSSLSDNFQFIRDCYFSKGVRIRHLNDQVFITRKTGDKYKGYRIEKEIATEAAVADLLVPEASLEIIKRRFQVENLECPPDKPYNVVVDFITSPMEIAVLEIEAADQMAYPIPFDITQRLFGVNLTDCPLCSWEYFNRKVGFCGGPSSGKTESAKWLSHQINTRFNGNAFHVTEYATSFIQKYGRHPEFGDQILLWHGQWKRERNANNSHFVISDCPTFLSYIYAQMLQTGEFNEKQALHLVKMYKQSLFDVTSYTDILLLAVQQYRDNGVRYQTIEEALEIQAKIQTFLDDHNIGYIKTSYENNETILRDLLYLNVRENYE